MSESKGNALYDKLTPQRKQLVDAILQNLESGAGLWKQGWRTTGAPISAITGKRYNLAKRIYEIIFMFFCMPVSMSTLPLDDGVRFKNWREQFLTKIILAYGAVLSVNVFILILPFIQQMSIPSVGGFANSMFIIFMIVGGAMVIPAGQTLFARLFGTADDMHAGGGWLRSAYYGGRVVSAMTIGLAWKGVKGVAKAVHNRKKNNNGSGGNNGGTSNGSSDSSKGGDEKYTDSGSATATATTSKTTDTGGSEE